MIIPLLTFVMGGILGATVIASLVTNKVGRMRELIERQNRTIMRLVERDFRRKQQGLSGGWKAEPIPTNRLNLN